MHADADDVIKEIDDGSLRPKTHPVLRALYRQIVLDDQLQKEVVAAFDRDATADEMGAFQAAVWQAIENRDIKDQGGLRLLVGLTRANEPVDWYLAEFIILWARQQGLAENQIIDAFYVDQRER